MGSLCPHDFKLFLPKRNDATEPSGDRPQPKRNDATEPSGDRPQPKRNAATEPSGARPFDRNDPDDRLVLANFLRQLVQRGSFIALTNIIDERTSTAAFRQLGNGLRTLNETQGLRDTKATFEQILDRSLGSQQSTLQTRFHITNSEAAAARSICRKQPQPIVVAPPRPNSFFATVIDRLTREQEQQQPKFEETKPFIFGEATRTIEADIKAILFEAVNDDFSMEFNEPTKPQQIQPQSSSSNIAEADILLMGFALTDVQEESVVDKAAQQQTTVITLTGTVVQQFSPDVRLFSEGIPLGTSATQKFALSIQVATKNGWRTVVRYEISDNGAVRYEIAMTGRVRVLRIDLPRKVTVDMAFSDLRSNWQSYSEAA